MTPLAKINISVLVGSYPEDGGYRVVCPFLNVTTYGNTEAKALANLKEEINFLFASCESVETLVAVVDARKSKCRDPLFDKDFVQVETLYLDLPSDVPPELLKRFADAARPTA